MNKQALSLQHWVICKCWQSELFQIWMPLFLHFAWLLFPRLPELCWIKVGMGVPMLLCILESFLFWPMWYNAKFGLLYVAFIMLRYVLCMSDLFFVQHFIIKEYKITEYFYMNCDDCICSSFCWYVIYLLISIYWPILASMGWICFFICCGVNMFYYHLRTLHVWLSSITSCSFLPLLYLYFG